ncbi:MAG: hypothetical protein NTW87_26210 [Planctomycetota bacterium]|nr:hypothetical protein [Planctomycetota bacterium]
MERADFAAALPYALGSAERGSGDGMKLLVTCYETQGKWDDAAVWVERLAELDGGGLDWFFWCKRTGKGPLARAQQAAEATAQYNRKPDARLDGELGVYHLVVGQPDKALPRFQRALELSLNPAQGLYAALTAETLKNTAARDAALEVAIKKGPQYESGNGGRRRPATVKLAAIFKEVFAKGPNGLLDTVAIDALAGGAPADEATDIHYFTGWFLDQRGLKEEANGYYLRAAQGTKERLTHVLARDILRARKIDAEQPPPKAIPTENVDLTF